MRKTLDEESVCPVDETENEKQQSYNNFERTLFLLILFIISALGLAISIPIYTLYVLVRCYSASKSSIKAFCSNGYSFSSQAKHELLDEQLQQSK